MGLCETAGYEGLTNQKLSKTQTKPTYSSISVIKTNKNWFDEYKSGVFILNDF